MSSTTANFSIRVPLEIKEKLDALAKAVDRPRNYLIAEAIERYVEAESWQVERILAGIADDEAGRTIPHEQLVAEVFETIGQAEARRAS